MFMSQVDKVTFLEKALREISEYLRHKLLLGTEHKKLTLGREGHKKLLPEENCLAT